VPLAVAPSTNMLQIAIIGSGPAGYYTAEACAKAFAGAQIDIIDKLPTPFGLIRAGVAPDHQSIKAVTKRYDATALTAGVAFAGHVDVGRDVSMAELAALYDAVVLATGAPADRPLGIPGEDLRGVIGSAALVGWYNGHPDFADLDVPLDLPRAAVIGNGNVAIDVARILAKTPGELTASDIASHAATALSHSAVSDIHVIGRRGPHQASFTPKEMGELGQLERAQPRVQAAHLPPVEHDAPLEPGLRKTVGHLRSFAAAEHANKPLAIHFDFFSRPILIERGDAGLLLTLERTRLDDDAAVGTGEYWSLDCGLIVPCIGYRTLALDDVPYDARAGRFVNDAGRIAAGLYAAGWARRGPTGTIGTNRADGTAVAEWIAREVVAGGKAGRDGLLALLRTRGVRMTGYADWQAIDAAEVARARAGAPREKFVRVSEMLALLP